MNKIMSTLPKQGDKFVYDGLVLEAKESVPSCVHCFFMTDEECFCTLNQRDGVLPRCCDPDNNKSIIYKYVREATEEEIRKGAADV